MKPKRLLQIISILTLSILIINCKKSTESESNWGDADFTTYVAIGNSLTAGVADGALYETTQKNSFPNLIAKMAEVDNEFEQPIMSGNGFSFKETDGRLQLQLTFPPSLVFLQPGAEQNQNLNRAFNNLGIPLIRAEQLYTANNSVDADSNHFVDKILRGSGRTAIQEALSLDPTLITLWVGSNDVLESATLGLANANSNYTIATEYSTHLTEILNQLTAFTNAPIFIANIVDITDLPYFSSLPPYVIDPDDGQKTYLFGECENDVIRELTDDDLVLYWALTDYFDFRNKLVNISTETALNDTVVLDKEEIAEIRSLIDDYNDIILNAANYYDQVYLVDINLVFKEIAQNGFTFSGVQYTSDIEIFDSEGVLNLGAFSTTLFSYDALHPLKYGYASFANAFIEVINASLNADIPFVSKSSDLN